MKPVLLLVPCPGALISLPLIDLSVTSGDHFPLIVRLPNEQLCHGAFVAVFGDASYSDLLAHHKISQWVSEQLWLALDQLFSRVVQGS